jgi:pentatricopeptide repeat protein
LAQDAKQSEMDSEQATLGVSTREPKLMTEPREQQESDQTDISAPTNDDPSISMKECVNHCDSSSKNRESTSLNSKERKRKLKIINAELAQLARAKELAKVQKIFRRLVSRGPAPDHHSYGSLINAFVRVGDVQGAEQCLVDMHAQGMQPGIVVLTTILRGLCEVGNMDKAAKLFASICVCKEGKIPIYRSSATVKCLCGFS